MNDKVINWGGNGPILHLAHANSFHPGTYIELIEALKEDFEVHSVLFRPFYPEADPKDMDDWDVLRDDFIEMADRQGWKHIIGIGHSLGSTVTMMAAIKRPDIFSKLVIIEPPCIDPIFFTLLDLAPYSLAKNIVPPSRIALKRRHKWPSRENAFDLLRPKQIFEKWSDKTLQSYLQYGLEEDENGEYRLAFSKYWESKIYCTIENPYKMFPKIKHPSLCIKGGQTDVINDRNWEKWKRIQNEATFKNIPNAGHLVPMEQPEILAQSIIDFARNN
jgi:pimeloyl-ACP methyl ester carboxylesterase